MSVGFFNNNVAILMNIFMLDMPGDCWLFKMKYETFEYVYN